MKITTSQLKYIIHSVLQEQFAPPSMTRSIPRRTETEQRRANETPVDDPLPPTHSAALGAAEQVAGTAMDVTADVRGQDYPPHRDAGLTPDEYDYARQYLVKASGRPEWEFTPQQVRGAANTIRMRQRQPETTGAAQSIVKDPLRKQQMAPDYDAFKRDLYEIIDQEIDKLL